MLVTGGRAPFAVFDRQDSGCVSYGTEAGGRRWFVKRATSPAAEASLRRALALHRRVRHPAVVRPVAVVADTEALALVYPWRDGRVLNQATVAGSDRAALAAFQTLPRADVIAALDVLLDAHLAVTATGFVAVDFYDGCLLYDFGRRRLHLVDLDEYRPGPFRLDADRLPGSLRYLAPEELTRGAVIDERTTVHALGRALQHLLDSPGGWRGQAAEREVVRRATDQDPTVRHPTVRELVAAWRAAGGG